MKLLESLIKRKTITIFFILAYTFAILTFSIGKSAITSQIIKNKNYNKLNNQLISFENCNIDITSEELLNILKDEDISIILFNYQYMHDNTIELTTELKSDGFFYAPDIKTGEYFSKDDFHSTEPIAIFSPTIKLNNNTFKLNSDIELHCKGIVYDRT